MYVTPRWSASQAPGPSSRRIHSRLKSGSKNLALAQGLVSLAESQRPCHLFDAHPPKRSRAPLHPVGDPQVHRAAEDLQRKMKRFCWELLAPPPPAMLEAIRSATSRLCSKDCLRCRLHSPR
eukprot:Skav207979  [mRNA]  locus=scaffold3328:34634:35865:+ [translate_table: standard]